MQMIPHENQLHLLKVYLHDGMSASTVIDLVALIADHLTVETIYS